MGTAAFGRKQPVSIKTIGTFNLDAT
jgi:hypothetical protein